MVYSNIVDASKTNFIIFSSNYSEDLSNIGSKINIKTYLPENIINNKYYEFDNTKKVFYEDNFHSDVFKNKLIFSSKLNNNKGFCLLTQQNLFHNIKYIHKNNDKKNPRIIFIKYNITNEIVNDNQYLIKDVADLNLTDISLNINNTDNDIETLENYKVLKKLNYFFNIYEPFVNSDYYKFKFSDFIDLSYILREDANFSPDFSYNHFKFKTENVEVFNNFSNDPLINYDVNNFTKLFKFKNSLIDGLKSSDVSDVNILELNVNNNYEDDNILIYNKFNNISSIRFDLLYPNTETTSNIPIPNYSDICINFVLVKGYDYNSKLKGKLFLTNDFIYLNSRVLNYNNNFYSTNSSMFSNNKIYLSLGNNITGITQKDLYTKMKFDTNLETTNTTTSNLTERTNIKKIHFTNKVISSVASNLTQKTYLLEEGYDYNYSNILYNNIQESNKKNITLDLSNFYHNLNSDFSQNIYNHRFNSLGLLNNEISSNHFDFSYAFIGSQNNKFFITNPSDLIFDNINYKLQINNTSVSSTANNLYNNIVTNNNIHNQLNYDFRFNYNSNIDLDIYFTLNYLYGVHTDLSFNKLQDYSGNNLLLNFHKVILTSNFITPGGSDFTNVDCVFVYYNPDDDNTPEERKYPNNNIEIINNPNVDTLTKAIELLPGASTSVTNTTFIPAKNGSNLSRKRIQGLIGFNNVPALLSILPYDENVIIGRGFLDQYQIENECRSQQDLILDKINSQKHSSIKNSSINNNLNINKISKNTSFANVARSRRRNRDLRTATTCTTEASFNTLITNYTTPFTNPMWKRR